MGVWALFLFNSFKIFYSILPGVFLLQESPRDPRDPLKRTDSSWFRPDNGHYFIPQNMVSLDLNHFDFQICWWLWSRYHNIILIATFKFMIIRPGPCLRLMPDPGAWYFKNIEPWPRNWGLWLRYAILCYRKLCCTSAHAVFIFFVFLRWYDLSAWCWILLVSFFSTSFHFSLFRQNIVSRKR